MSGNVSEYLAPSVTSFVDDVTINIFSREALGLDLQMVDTGLASAVWTSNLLIFVPLVVAEPLLVSQFFWFNGTAVSGSTDVGIYNADGTVKLGSTGSTLNSGTSQIQTVDIADFHLPANSRLWLALGCENATQTFQRATLVVGAMDYIGIKQQAAGWSSGLPTPATFAIPTVAVLPVFGFTGGAI